MAGWHGPVAPAMAVVATVVVPLGTMTKATRPGAARSGREVTTKSVAAAPDHRTVKVSVALPRSLWEEARAAVKGGSLSALVTAALRRELAGRRTDTMLAELDALHGPVPPELATEVDATWQPIFNALASRE